MEFEALAAADRQELVRLADLLEAGLLTPPTSALSLCDHMAAAHAESVAQCLEKLSAEGMPPVHIALMLRAFTAGAQAAGGSSLPVELVVSGPDATGGARDTGVVMRQLFARARERVMAVGFAVRQGKAVFRTLADRLDGDEPLEATLCIDVRRQHGDTSIDRDILRRFANEFVRNEWPGSRLPRVYYDPRSLDPAGRTASSMHAKCVVIDGREVLVTSANFTEAAQQRNIELGLLVNSQSVARKIEEHFMSLIMNRNLARLPMP
ncbi:MAG: DISARM system phospholipase D-like protein DrmC [Gammaproteobacteria bacterium]|nr:DISARM system phospholipase D-like protein DrmC [Gammaproteobacteria bacterium]